ncbi:hypothetical protein N7470_007336 [Penicillium chermesinum]|nr:hypothetical protein N7470_007336 [Penicillium chermesinum]
MFPEWFTRVLDQVPEVALFQIRDQDPLPIYFKHQTVLIGDAAHAILPLGAQGANQALEDAEGLDALLADVTDHSKTRAAATQRTARGFESVLSSKANQDKVLASKPFVEMRVLAGM